MSIQQHSRISGLSLWGCLVMMVLLFSSCAETVTREARYPGMYAERPVSIAIMPPINQTQFVEAKEYFYTTLYQPLCEKGYYVFSPQLTMQMFQSESAYDAELFLNADISRFGKVLGADALIFTVIKEWRKNAVAGTITVDIQYIIRSTKTNEILYQREGKLTLDTSVQGNSSGALGLLLDMAATAVNTAVTDKIVVGRKCNAYVLSDLPVGKYNEMLYGKDGTMASGSPVFTGTIR